MSGGLRLLGFNTCYRPTTLAREQGSINFIVSFESVKIEECPESVLPGELTIEPISKSHQHTFRTRLEIERLMLFYLTKADGGGAETQD